VAERGLFLVRNNGEVGSRYKYRVMFQRVAELRIVSRNWAPQAIWRSPYAVVFGDRSAEYRQALAGRAPYILIENDVATARGKEFPQEREMIENAQAVLFNSEYTRDYCEERYRVRHSEVAYLRPLARDLEFEPMPKLEGRNIVYAGGILPMSFRDTEYGYRSYHQIFASLMEVGWTVHVYPSAATAGNGPEYERIGCVVHEPVPANDLYRELSQYQAGLQAYAYSGPQEYLMHCKPNKTWEYLAAGIPTLGINSGAAGEVYDGRWGYVDTGDLAETSRKVLQLEIPDDLRREQVIDHDRPVFERLAADVARGHGLARMSTTYPPEGKS
jgi:hypothetical protein